MRYLKLLMLASLACSLPLLLAGCGGGEETGSIDQPTATASSSADSSGLGKIAYSLDGIIYVKALPDSEPQRLVNGSSPRWSPSGDWLLFQATEGQWVMRADGCSNGPLGTVCPQTRHLAGHAVWAPREDRLAYTVPGYHTMTIVAEMADGSDRREWSVPAGEPRGMNWSPDGKWLACAEVVDEGGRRSELWAMPLDSSNGTVERPVPTFDPPPTSVPLEERTGRATLYVDASVPTDNPLVGSILTQDATIHIVGDGIDLSATTAENGIAAINDIPVSTDPERPTRVNVTVSAPGYAPFVFLWVPLYPDDAVRIGAGLSDQPQVDDLSGPVPPIRPAPTPAPILTPIAPPPGGVELWGSAEDGIELAGWSGDSQHVLFWLDPQFADSAMNDGLPLLSVPASGGESRQLTFSLRSGVWEPAPGDDATIVMTEGASRFTWTAQRILLADVATGKLTYLTGEDTASQQPAWSPDGERIAFVSQPDRGQGPGGSGEELEKLCADRRIWVINSDGSDKRQLTEDPQYRDERPLWASDGSQILFARLDMEGRASLWLVPTAGGEPQQVVALQDVVPDGGRSIGWDNSFDWWRGP